MKITLQKALEANAFYGLVFDKKMPIKTTYKIVLMGQALEQPVAFYAQKFKEIVLEYAEKNTQGEPILLENGEGIKITEGRESECNQALLELYELEIDLPDIFFSIDEFDGIEINVQDLKGILPFINQ